LYTAVQLTNVSIDGGLQRGALRRGLACHGQRATQEVK